MSLIPVLALAGMSLTVHPGVRPVSTYSIVARDAETGQLGVAVQSHWFSVGSVVPWAEAGVGAVATQSFVEASYGPLGLDLMRAGRSAPQALKALLVADEQAAVRQVAMVDAKGRVGVHTGEHCIAQAGHATGEGFSVQANLMERDTVWPAMERAFRSARGSLAERMLAALEAAEAQGGDIRGRQSAAILVVAAVSTGRPWADRIVDLRVEDSPDPLVELRRLLRLSEAYTASNRGDELFAAGDLEAAIQAYGEAARLAPHMVELEFWQAVTMAGAGAEDAARPIFERVFAREERWRLLIPRLVPAGLLPENVAARILESPAGQASPSSSQRR